MPPIPLDYASPPPRRPRLIVLWISLGLFIVMLAGVYFLLATHVRRTYSPGPTVAQLYQACAADAPPAGTVAFDDTPIFKYPYPPESLVIFGWDGAGRRGRQPMAWFNLRIATWPQVWPDDPVLFLHELNRPGCAPRLVLVHARVSENQQQTSIGVNAALMQARFAPPAEALESLGPVLIDQHTPGPTPIRIFAGQADPNDPAHFTIRYVLNGSTYTIGGFLKADATSPVGESILFK